MRSTLSKAIDFFEQIVRPDTQEFFNNPSTLRNAVHLSNSLYHFHEWMFVDYKNEAAIRFDAEISKPADLWSHAQDVDIRFGYIRDVANASKHVTIDRKPSTGMKHISNTFIETTGWGEGRRGQAKWGGAPMIVMIDGQQAISFDD